MCLRKHPYVTSSSQDQNGDKHDSVSMPLHMSLTRSVMIHSDLVNGGVVSFIVPTSPTVSRSLDQPLLSGASQCEVCSHPVVMFTMDAPPLAGSHG